MTELKIISHSKKQTEVIGRETDNDTSVTAPKSETTPFRTNIASICTADNYCNTIFVFLIFLFITNQNYNTTN